MISRAEVIDYYKEYEGFSVKAVPRELKVPLNSEFIISIIGPRRAGKTYYLLSLREMVEGSAYLNFEDSRLYGATYKDIRDIIRIFIEIYGEPPKFLLFDEVQNVENWEVAVRELHDLKKYSIFITGSSSKLLSEEISTRLRGRTLSYLLLPFSFREFLTMKRVEFGKYLSRDEEARVKNLLMEFLEFGGFPDVIKSEEKVRILKEYSDLILFRDFVERHKVRNLDLARALHSLIIQNFSNEISLRSLFNKLKAMNVKVAKDTVYEYVSKLEDTVFFFFLRKFSWKVHLRESWPKKVYLCDQGLAKVHKSSAGWGRLMENVVFLELMRMRNSNPLIEIFYLKLMDGEVDFVVKEGSDVKRLVQVTYASSRDEVGGREIKALLKAGELLNCRDLLCITWDYEAEEKFNSGKVKFVPLWKWLLGGA